MLATRRPLASYLLSGAILETSQLLLPQRSKIHMLLPSRATLRPMVEPNPRPMGCFAQPSSGWYGLTAGLGSEGAWDQAGPPETPFAAARGGAGSHFTRSVFSMTVLPVELAVWSIGAETPT